MAMKVGGPGSRGAKFEISRNGKVQYFHHGNTKHPSGHGLAHPIIKPIVKPVIPKLIVKQLPKKEDKPKQKLTREAKPSPPKSSKALNHHIATGHKNLLIKRG